MQRRELIVHVEVPDQYGRMLDNAENAAHLAALSGVVQHLEGRMQVMEIHTEPAEHFGGFFQGGATDGR